MPKLFVLSFLLLSVPMFAQQDPVSATIPNIQNITTNWSECILPSCNAGGNGVPVSFTQTFDDTVEEKDSQPSMAIAMVAKAATQGTNGLWTYKPLWQSGTFALSMDQWVYPDSNMLTYGTQLEFDQAIFDSMLTTEDTPYGTEFMFGSQCNLATGKWQIFNQACSYWGGSGCWVDVTPTLACSIPSSGWHHLEESVHRVQGDPGNCSYNGYNYPCEYYDSITIDGHTTYPTNTNLPAGPLLEGWDSFLLIQMQINAGPNGTSGNAMTTYYDLINFTYTYDGEDD
jgi:hypothetical protein